MKLTVIGTGYVGLVTGACFAEMGNTVTCLDVDREKIDGLARGVMPIYEPGLEQIVIENHRDGRLAFTTSWEEAAREAEVFIVAVGTPPGEDGSADLTHVLAVAREIGRHITRYAVVVDKSTVPVGTAEQVRAAIVGELAARGPHGLSVEVDVVSNPEFLKEGAAVDDFMKPDRIILGSDSERATALIHALYAPFTRSRERMITMSVRAAEMTKYAANAMLATRISFMNEIAALCERSGVDVEDVRRGIGSDSRIGYAFIYPGCGFGGSCFPKDLRALIHMAEHAELEPRLLRAVVSVNDDQKRVLPHKIFARFGPDLSGLTFALWGLAFKPGTDDMREASSAVLMHELIGAGATVRAFDPAAMEAARRELPRAWLDEGKLVLAENQYDALAGASALVLVTEWKSFRHPDFERIKGLLASPVVFDGRNQYDPKALRAMGFEYSGIGR